MFHFFLIVSELCLYIRWFVNYVSENKTYFNLLILFLVGLSLKFRFMYYQGQGQTYFTQNVIINVIFSD